MLFQLSCRSVGEDIHEAKVDSEAEILIDPKRLPRKHSIMQWHLEDWVKSRLKRRMVEEKKERDLLDLD